MTPAQAIELRLANNGSDPTTAEIKISKMYPYLRLEQIRKKTDKRVILTCSPEGTSRDGGNCDLALSIGIH